MPMALLLLSLAGTALAARPFAVGDFVLLNSKGSSTATTHPRCLSLPGQIYGTVRKDDGSSVHAFNVRCTSFSDYSSVGPAEGDWYDNSELRSLTATELVQHFSAEAQEFAPPLSEPAAGPTKDSVSTCAALSTCGECTASAACKWCMGQHACKPTGTNDVCTHDYHSTKQCELAAKQTTGWFELPQAQDGGDGLFVTFHFTPAKRLGGGEDNAFGIQVGPTQASAVTPVLLRQRRRSDGVQGCLDSTDNSFMPPALCNFDREMEYTLRLRRGEVSLVERGGSYTFGGPTPPSGWWRLTSRGGTISDIEVLTAEEEFVVSSIKSGASRAVADGSSSLCNKGSAECGGSCWGVCRACGPPRYCMCYPNGYIGVTGAMQPGASCLLQPGEGGTKVEAPAPGQKGKQAFEEL